MSEGNQKVPSQIFKWFERMKNNYESSVQSVLSRFESYNAQQQLRLDNANAQHLNDIKTLHEEKITLQQNNIEQLNKEILFYQQQIQQQQQTIERLNGRYDAVVACIVTQKDSQFTNIKDIFENDDFFVNKTSSELTSTSNVNNDIDIKENNQSTNHSHTRFDDDPYSENTDELFEQALTFRNDGSFEEAFNLFQQAANESHAKSMGAMGRSYFLGEGIEEDHELGLAWLIRAANHSLSQAISRVEHFKENDPELFHRASLLVAEIDE